MRRTRTLVAAALAAAIVVAGTARQSHAGPMPDPPDVGRFTGIIGLTLVGFEAVFDVELAVGIRNGIILGLSSVVGAAGAGIGGYYVEKELTRARGGLSGPGPVAVLFLCVGMAGVVPTVIAWKNTNFARSKEAKGAAVVEEAPAGSGPSEGEPAPPPAAPERGGLVSVTPGGIFVGAPAIEWGPGVGAIEAEAAGAAGPRLAATVEETRVTLLRWDF